MDYETIKKEIEALIEEAQQTTHGRVETVLEPLRESLIEARRQGVKLHKLFTKLTGVGLAISPSSFAKYSQKHLQVKKAKGRQRPIPSIPTIQTQHKKQDDLKPTQPTKSTAGKPRMATGNY